MFCPTHMLVSRSRRTPVQLMASPNGFYLVSELEIPQKREPSFEIRPKLGIFCKGIPLVGYRLEPLAVEVSCFSQSSPSVSSLPQQP